ncbi:M3 family metallopeptidase [Oceanicella actignis]|uniref:M3 family metallopeptidase n=1 Tax=Oceanicella actignis TaxID=1189325 RepID=UPI0011E637CC|nr:M3 family metallopeptidase [Oceanicella actignis]TYO91252.1 peptidyl-dipeptidase Dcp [Oceanicella actignis]
MTKSDKPAIASPDELAPFAAPLAGPLELPPFDAAGPERWPALFRAAIAEHERELERIAQDPRPADFGNVIDALEASGRALGRLCAAFFTLASCCSDDALRAAEREVAPLLAGHRARMWSDSRLLARIDALAARADALAPDAEAARVLMLYRREFERAGARLPEAARARLAAISAELAALGARFSQNVLADEAGWTLQLGEGDLAGLPADVIDAARRAARERGMEGWAITLARSSVEPFLTFSARRDLREAAWRAWAGRGTGAGAGGSEADNRPLIRRILALRAERARLLGHPNYAAFKLAPQMAGAPEAVRALLDRVWAPARARALDEARALSALAAEEGANIALAPWDWRHYAEKLRKRLHDFDEAAVKPYLALDNVIAAAFDVAGRLFGLEFAPVEGLALHHPDARAWRVTRGGRHVGLFVGDYFARPSKRSGAWMSALRAQENFDPRMGEVRPIVLNVMNFAQAEGPSLLSWDDARTLFHEFGHALHGLLSDVRHPFVSGTAVARDFVELPSQLFEHWLSQPEVLARHARHVETGAPMPQELIARLRAAETFNQGFATVEYVASAAVDLALHELPDPEAIDPAAFEAELLSRMGMPEAVAMRHASPHFLHVFAGEGYSVGYYSYMWAEVMDADAFGAFEEAGDPFDPEVAARLERHIYAAGGSRDPAEAYRAFRGRDPDPAALLRRRGLAGQGASEAAATA